MKTKCVKCGRTYINTNDLCTVCRGKKPNPFDILDHIDEEIELNLSPREGKEERVY